MAVARRWKAAIGVLAVTAAVAIGVVVLGISSSARTVASPERIAVDSPDAVPGLGGRQLKAKYQVDGIDFAGKRTGARLPGELIVDWYADGGLSFHQEVWALEDPLDAWWKFRSENPESRFAREGGGDLLVDVDPLKALHADSYRYFCGNVGHSKRKDFEDCQVWGYWARYGQYLIYLELSGKREPKSSMDDIVQYFDARMGTL
ncbi:hypothetical protein GCM10010429_49800 [Micromonospora olivasterospora]